MRRMKHPEKVEPAIETVRDNLKYFIMNIFVIYLKGTLNALLTITLLDNISIRV